MERAFCGYMTIKDGKSILWIQDNYGWKEYSVDIGQLQMERVFCGYRTVTDGKSTLWIQDDNGWKEYSMDIGRLRASKLIKIQFAYYIDR